MATAFCFVCCYFNPRSRVGNDLRAGASMLSTLGFQSTFPRGERRFIPATRLIFVVFQSTFPRGERQPYCYDTSVTSQFQSTFPRGERHTDNVGGVASTLFQSTFPRGERLVFGYHVRKSVNISIHVPAWGTTYAVFLLCSVINYFNPRSRVGNDL